MLKEKNKFIISWLKLNEDHQSLKIISLILTASIFLSIISFIWLASRSPLIVNFCESEKKEFQIAKRLNLKVSERDLEDIALKFISARYSWDSMNIESIVNGLTPFVTKNLRIKISQDLEKLKKQFPDDKKISLSLNDLKTDVTMEKILVTFDQIIKVDNIPLINPTEIEFLMMEGTPNDLNPLGIYINNITQFEKL